MLGRKNIGGLIMTLHKIEEGIVTVQIEGEKKRQRVLIETESGYGFKFRGTFWLLGYDFNLVYEGGKVVPVESKKESEYYPFFVYGTLRQGMGNHSKIKKAYDKLVPAKTEGLMYHNGSFPYLFEGTEGTARGELVYIKPKQYKRTMKVLDSLEGYYGEGKEKRWNHYNRRLVTCVLPSGEEVKAWVYFANVTKRSVESFIKDRLLTKIKDGDFIRWYREYRNDWDVAYYRPRSSSRRKL